MPTSAHDHYEPEVAFGWKSRFFRPKNSEAEIPNNHKTTGLGFFEQSLNHTEERNWCFKKMRLRGSECCTKTASYNFFIIAKKLSWVGRKNRFEEKGIKVGMRLGLAEKLALLASAL